MSGGSSPVVVAGYRLLEPLGAGGEGAVWLAEGTDGLGKKVALKLFLPAARARFERELEAYRRVEDVRSRTGTPHLLEGLAAGPLPDGGGFVALAWQTGGTLDDLVRRAGPRAAAEATALALQVARGVSALHAAGLCHRDVKPSNVLLGGDGVARLGDLGLATDHRGAISTGGTPAFAAPEQWTDLPGEPARSGVAIDVFGIAATLHFLLTGRPPPLGGGADVFALESRQVPRPLQAVLHRALSPRPEDRHADAGVLLGALEGLSGPVASAPRSGFPVAVAALGVALTIGAVVLALRTNPPARAQGIVPPVPDRPAPPAPAAVVVPQATTPAPETSAAVADIAPTLERRRVQDGIELSLRAVDGRSRRLGRAPRGALAAASRSRVVVALPPTDEAPARLEAWSLAGDGEVGPAGRRTLADLADLATHLVVVDDDCVAVALRDGSVDLVLADGRVREVARFGHGVDELALAPDGAIIITGDDRTPQALPAGDPAPPGSVVIEGALGRWALPARPAPRKVTVRR